MRRVSDVECVSRILDWKAFGSPYTNQTRYLWAIGKTHAWLDVAFDHILWRKPKDKKDLIEKSLNHAAWMRAFYINSSRDERLFFHMLLDNQANHGEPFVYDYEDEFNELMGLDNIYDIRKWYDNMEYGFECLQKFEDQLVAGDGVFYIPVGYADKICFEYYDLPKFPDKFYRDECECCYYLKEDNGKPGRPLKNKRGGYLK